MKNVKLLLIVAVVAGSIGGCKKGENDPFLSLKSRKARLSGEWTLSEKKETRSYVSGAFSNTTVTNFDGTTSTQTQTVNGNTSTYSNKYSETIEFKKDGAFTITTLDYYANGQLYERAVETGNWVFLGKNKDADVKNKEKVLLNGQSYNSTTYNDDGTIDDVFVSNIKSYTFAATITLDRLSKKEMDIVLDYSRSYNDDNSSSTSTSASTCNYTKK